MSTKNVTEAEACTPHAPATGALFFFKVGDKDLKLDHPEARAADILRTAGYDPKKYLLIKISNGHEHDHLQNDEVVNLLEYGIEKFDVELRMVEIFINGNGVMVLPGVYLVSDLKKKLNTPAAHILASLVNQQLAPLDDSSKVEIDGGEKFISYPCDGQAS